jgi:hypothetical protein
MQDLTRAIGTRRLCECLAIFFMFLLMLGLLEDAAIMSIFHERDVFRAREILSGSAPFLGPETNRGSFLPGAFYYYLLAFALYLRDHLSSTYFLLATLQAATLGIGYAYLTSKQSYRAGLIYLLLYGGSSFSLLNFLLFYNPSYLPLFALACLIFCERHATKGRLFWLLGAGLASGLALQIQGSAVALFIFGLAAAGLFALREKGRALLSPATFLLGFLLAYLPWLPSIYTASRSGEAALLPPYSWGLLQDQLFGEGVATVGPIFFRNSLNVFGPALVLTALALLSTRPGDIRASILERMSFGAAVCALPSALYYFITSFGERYALLFHFFLIIALSLWITRRRWPQGIRIKFLAAVLFGFAVAGSWLLPGYRMYLPERFTVSDARALGQVLARAGHTEYSHARAALYGIGFFKDLAFYFQLEEAVKESKVRFDSKPDGFFFSRKDIPVPEDGVLLADEDIRRWLKNGALVVGPMSVEEGTRIRVQPYFSGHGTVVPVIYGNIGESYIGRSGLGESTVDMSRDFGGGFSCKMGASYIPTPDPNALRLRIFGISLSTTLLFVAPDCVAQLSDIFLEYTCMEGPSTRIGLLSTLGPVYKNRGALKEVASAPVELQVRLPCVPQRIFIGYGSSTFLSIHGSKRREGGARHLLK